MRAQIWSWIATEIGVFNRSEAIHARFVSRPLSLSSSAAVFLLATSALVVIIRGRFPLGNIHGRFPLSDHLLPPAP
jgi:hypothetical protein